MTIVVAVLVLLPATM